MPQPPRFAEDRTDAGMGVLQEGAGVPVEINGLFRIEYHAFPGIDLEDVVFQCPMAQGTVQSRALGVVHALYFTQLFRESFGRSLHYIEEVVCIDHGAFPGFHSA